MMTTYNGLWEYAKKSQEKEANVLRAILDKLSQMISDNEVKLVYVKNLFEDYMKLELLLLTKDRRIILAKPTPNGTALQASILDLLSAEELTLIAETAEQIGWRIGFRNGDEFILKSDTDNGDLQGHSYIANLRKIYFLFGDAMGLW